MLFRPLLYTLELLRQLMEKRGRPKKAIKFTKTINVRLTQSQWLQILNAADKDHLEPSVFIRKTLLDTLQRSEQMFISKK